VSLGLRLLAKLPASSPEPEQLADRIENWIHRKYPCMFPRTRQGVVESSPTVFCQLHPAAEDVELTLIDPIESDEIAITPLGPRNRDWLQETAQQGSNGKDFFAWWTPGFNAEYYLGRALTHMWSNVRWRSPINDKRELHSRTRPTLSAKNTG
jgi:hypothetical protein